MFRFYLFILPRSYGSSLLFICWTPVAEPSLFLNKTILYKVPKDLNLPPRTRQTPVLGWQTLTLCWNFGFFATASRMSDVVFGLYRTSFLNLFFLLPMIQSFFVFLSIDSRSVSIQRGKHVVPAYSWPAQMLALWRPSPLHLSSLRLRPLHRVRLIPLYSLSPVHLGPLSYCSTFRFGLLFQVIACTPWAVWTTTLRTWITRRFEFCIFFSFPVQVFIRAMTILFALFVDYPVLRSALIVGFVLQK